jgi:hypothetical protein
LKNKYILGNLLSLVSVKKEFENENTKKQFEARSLF